MEVSTSFASQSLALAAYSAQQQPPARPGTGERDNAAVDQTRQDTTRSRADNVSFSPEAQRLSALASNPGAVNRGTESDTQNNNQQRQQQNAAAPQLLQASSADTVAQALNAYGRTSVL